GEPPRRRFEWSFRCVKTPNAPARARWFDGWKGKSPPRLGKYADAFRRCEVAEARTWLLEKGWRRIGLVDPAEMPGTRRRRQASAAV
ncbi:MAG: hypothetical protein OXQ90_06425, partial [Gammaproteobacteria bacterium]|nr:hypothetical protein [Gammaproteobacteria bacterium]